jgi:hypothetical protein
MFGSEILEVAIGIMFIYLLVAIICSAIREGIEAYLKTRAAYLEYGVRELLHDKTATGLASAFYNHPLIYSLYAKEYKTGKSADKPKMLAFGRDLPSYIPSRNFALTIMDIAARGQRTDVYSSHPSSPAISLENVRANILNIGSEPVQRALLTAIDSAQGDFNRAQKNIEAWYDSGMDRVSGWYKRTTQKILFFIGLGVAITLNINTITLVDYLYHDDAARTALVARAEAAAADTTLRNQTNYAQARAALDSLTLPIGWEYGIDAARRPNTQTSGVWFDFFTPALGWLITALAAMFGAPFWFDLLNKFMVIRSTVKPHEKSPEEGSEDRQPKQRAPQVVAVPDAAAVLASAPAQPVLVPAGAAVPFSPFSSGDLESDVDACDAEMDDGTDDEDLPPARGGVA